MTKVLKLWVLISKHDGESVCWDSIQSANGVVTSGNVCKPNYGMMNTLSQSKGYVGNDDKGHELITVHASVKAQGNYATIFTDLNEAIKVRNELGLQKSAVPKRLKTVDDVIKYNANYMMHVWAVEDVEHARRIKTRRTRKWNATTEKWQTVILDKPKTIGKAEVWKHKKEVNYQATGYKLV